MVGTVAELDQGRRRSVEVRVKLSPALADAFNSIAEARGLLPATLAAYALGEYVERHEQQASVTRMMALDASRRMAEVFTDEAKLGKLLSTALSHPEVAKLISQGSPEGGSGA